MLTLCAILGHSSQCYCFLFILFKILKWVFNCVTDLAMEAVRESALKDTVHTHIVQRELFLPPLHQLSVCRSA